jgi:hypothetical protein
VREKKKRTALLLNACKRPGSRKFPPLLCSVYFPERGGGVGVADEKGHARQVQIIIFFGWKMQKFFFPKERKKERGWKCMQK